MSEIPIQNIYYMLCYAWDRPKEKDLVNVDASGANQIVDLFANVLLKGVKLQLKRGLDRDYNPFHEEIRGIRGKIDFAHSIKQLSFKQAKAYCHFDEFNYDVLTNQIIKSTIHSLIKTTQLDRGIRKQLLSVYRRLNDITLIRLQHSHFSMVRIHRNNSFYRFLTTVCAFIYENLLPEESTGRFQFKDFHKDRKTMAIIFETFIRNYYRYEQSQYKISSKQVRWELQSLNPNEQDYLPVMRTDITCHSTQRNIIIDTKYYLEMFQVYQGKKTIRSEHLYQLFSYLSNGLSHSSEDTVWEGILLYPTVKEHVDLNYEGNGVRVSVKTINLNQDWKQIHCDLLKIIGVTL
ncbi:5-methylcytosine-specific restriction endonuclease system specificity protein McrC [Bacillus toyonensis]|uniref:5-methylcytosine-specific restriction endonuclease system specificity protein McrC n=1 Tax=Bacillus toyonensis TaxID=155322 RepID=UPI0036ED3876